MLLSPAARRWPASGHVQRVAQLLGRREGQFAAGRDGYGLPRGRVAALALRPVLHFELAEAGQEYLSTALGCLGDPPPKPGPARTCWMAPPSTGSSRFTLRRWSSWTSRGRFGIRVKSSHKTSGAGLLADTNVVWRRTQR